MRVLIPASILMLCVLAVTSVAQQLSRPPTAAAASGIRPILPNQLELTNLRLAQQRAAGARQQIDAMRARLKLPPLDPAVIARTKVPVLTIARAAFANLRLRTTQDHYTAAGGDETRGFILTGTRLARTVPRPEGLRSLKPDHDKFLKAQLALRNVVDPITDIEVSKTEDGVDVSFRRFGAIYDLRLSCADPDSEACSREEALKLLAETVLVGGGS